MAPGTSPSGLHDLLRSCLRVLVAPALRPFFALVTSELQVDPDRSLCHCYLLMRYLCAL